MIPILAPSGGALDGLDLRFHHVGIACPNPDRETHQLAALGYRPEGEDFIDPIQRVRVRFLGGQSPRLELLAPLGPGSALEPWLRGKAELYHLAYETADLRGALDMLRARRARVVAEPVPAVAFGGRPIAFLVLPNRLLIELIGDIP